MESDLTIGRPLSTRERDNSMKFAERLDSLNFYRCLLIAFLW